MEEINCKACGLCNDYRTEQSGQHIKAVCNGCGRYIKFISQGKPSVLHFGKYKGREIASMRSPTEVEYLKWMMKNVSQKKVIEQVSMYLKSIAAI